MYNYKMSSRFVANFVLLLQLLISLQVVLTLGKECSELLPQPTNGTIEYRISKENKTIAILSCHDGYTIDGNEYVECDDNKWSNQIGKCVESTTNAFNRKDLSVNENRNQRIQSDDVIGSKLNTILRALDSSSGAIDSEDDAEVDEDESNDSDTSSDNSNIPTNNGTNTTIASPTTMNGNGTTTLTTMTPNSTIASSNSTSMNNESTTTAITTDTSTSTISSSSSSSSSVSSSSSTSTTESDSSTGSSSTTSSPDTTIGLNTTIAGNTPNNNTNATINSTMHPFPNAGIRSYVSSLPIILVVLGVSKLFIN